MVSPCHCPCPCPILRCIQSPYQNKVHDRPSVRRDGILLCCGKSRNPCCSPLHFFSPAAAPIDLGPARRTVLISKLPRNISKACGEAARLDSIINSCCHILHVVRVAQNLGWVEALVVSSSSIRTFHVRIVQLASFTTTSFTTGANITKRETCQILPRKREPPLTYRNILKFYTQIFLQKERRRRRKCPRR